jgi:hypothetical protein
MSRDDQDGKASTPVDFHEPVTLAWDARGVFDDPERAAWAWDLVRKTLGVDEDRFAAPANEPDER